MTSTGLKVETVFADAFRELLSRENDPALKIARERAYDAFVDLGVSRCAGRSGVLVYVAMFERLVEVVPDVGVDVKALGPKWTKALADLQTALDRELDF